MSILESVSMALKNILSSKMRTFLTMLGIIIGVAAVTLIVGLGNGLQGYISDSFQNMGTDALTVSVRSRGATRTLDVDDIYDIVEKNSEYLDLCSPTATVFGFAKVGSETLTSSTSGVSEDYDEIKNLDVAQGRWLQYSDIRQRSHNCVIGQYINMTYYGGKALGDTIRIGGQMYKIVGILEQQEDEMEEGGSDDCVYVPYSTASRTTGRITSFTVTMKSEDNISEAKEALEDSLYNFFGSDDFYTVVSMAEVLDTMNEMIDIVVIVLAGIAAISLVVGGIGIMNIMLVSVTERTREIGIRKSLGAKERYIMEQFVIEAATTSALGGALGIVFGYGLSALATNIATSVLGEELTVAPSGSAVMLAFGISVGIGILFGYLPAKKAARLNPIDALRYE